MEKRKEEDKEPNNNESRELWLDEDIIEEIADTTEEADSDDEIAEGENKN